MKLGAGELDKRIAILAATTADNDFGEPVQSWSVAQTVSGKATYGTGQERREAAQESASIRATILLRSSAFTRGLSVATNALRFDGGDWDIESAALLGRNEAVSITASRRAE